MMRILAKVSGIWAMGMGFLLFGAFSDPVKTRYSSEEFRYFSETAFLPDRNIVRWDKPIYLQLAGNYTAKDEVMAEAMIAELQPLLGPLRLSRVKHKGNIVIHYTKTLKEFTRNRETGEQHPLGYALTEINDSGSIDSAAIYLHPGLLDFKKREVLGHEICHSLGLLQHSKSMYGEHALMTEIGSQSTAQARKTGSGNLFPRLDRTAIRLLYDRDIPANTSRQAVLRLAGLR